MATGQLQSERIAEREHDSGRLAEREDGRAGARQSGSTAEQEHGRAGA